MIYDPASNTFRGTSALEDKHPDEGSAQPSAELEIGRAIIVLGPATFALWPGESLGDTLSRLFHNTPLEPLVDKLVLPGGG